LLVTLDGLKMAEEKSLAWSDSLYTNKYMMFEPSMDSAISIKGLLMVFRKSWIH
jgi:hypothetical protein